jgi:two-component system nitrogen regulation response regulator GlnG
VAATHQNLESNVKTGAFREDLFHRLNVIRIHLPALRDRAKTFQC